MSGAVLSTEYTSVNSFEQLLTGPDAFYYKSNYLEATQSDFTSRVALPTSYTWNTYPMFFFHWLSIIGFTLLLEK